MSELKLQQSRLDGRYEILDCLGRGSYAEIYVARDTAATGAMPAKVVIKALNVFLQGSPEPDLERTLIENFRNEALALDRVRHPNIISRLGHGTALDLAGRPFHYLLLEYMPGGDMAALCRFQRLTVAQTLHYLEQVCIGLAYAHAHQVIHRDIKPQNLLLSADRRTVKIADFGVAKIEAHEGAITRVGTEIYAAPEHHPLARTGSLADAPLTQAADIYSLAKTAYRLLTGDSPRRFALHPIEDLPETVAGEKWASDFLRVLRRATQTEPTERYQTMQEFWAGLSAALQPTAATQPLADTTGDLTRAAARGRYSSETGAHNLPPQPAPEFAPIRRGMPAEAAPRQHERFVVPVAAPRSPLEKALNSAQPSPAPVAATPKARAPLAQAESDQRTPRASWARNWLVAALIIAAFAAMLFATHQYAQRVNLFPWSRSQPAASSDSPVGREFVATTNVNLRSEAQVSNNRIGIIEKDSRVRVLRISGNWYEIEVLQRPRPKPDASWADRGWVDRRNFEPGS